MDQRTQEKIGSRTFSVVEVAECLMDELGGLEKSYPHVLDDETYRRLKGEIETEAKSPNNDTFGKLQGRYRELRACLERIENIGIESLLAYKKEKVTDGTPATALERKALTLANYLPESFDDFGKIVAAIQQNEDYYHDGCVAAAEMIVMGELEAGIHAVVPRFREEVRTQLLETIREDCDKDDTILEDEMDGGEREKKLLELFSENDDKLADKLIDTALKDIVLTIISIRKAIRGEESGVKNLKEVTVGQIKEAEHEGEIGVAQLWKATVGLDIKKHTPQALRKEIAERVILIRPEGGTGFLRLIK